MIEYNPNDTVTRIALLLNRTKKTKKELNDFCGLSKDTIYHSANSKSGLSARVLLNVAEFFQCPVDYLLGRDGYAYDISTNRVVKLSSLNKHDQQLVKDRRAEGKQTNFEDISKNRQEPKTDNLTDEFIKRFSKLDFEQKIRVINFALEIDAN